METFRADVDVMVRNDGTLFAVTPGFARAVAACRCYRCGVLLTVDTVTADRIKPGCQGGTYVRSNLRPACLSCNAIEGVRIRERLRAERVSA